MALTHVFSYYPGMGLDPLPTKPWRLGSWVWASNGHVLVAVADDGRDADDTPENRQKATRYLEDEPIGPQSASLAALRAFAGPVIPNDRPCEECDGTGRSEMVKEIRCEHCGQLTRSECYRCGGDGRAAIATRYVRVFGVPLNAVLLAFGLSHVPDDEAVTIGRLMSPSSAGTQHPALVIVGAGWRVAVMSCRHVDDDVPVFPAVDSPEADDAVARSVPNQHGTTTRD